MNRLRLVLLAACALLAIGAGAAGPAAPTGKTLRYGPPAQLLGRAGLGTAASSNWSGYAAYAGGTTFSDVQGSWVQPSVSCPSPQRQYSAFWIGLDGYNSGSVEQIGTSSDCKGKNRPSYYAWYEMYPAAPVTLPLAVNPGDTISAGVSSSGSNFTLTLTNTSTGQSFSTTQSLAGAALSSAEWVAEAPSSCSRFSCKVLPLANFGTVNFSGSYATGNGHQGTISDASWSNDQIAMVANLFTVKAQPSSLSPDGSAFSVTWQHS